MATLPRMRRAIIEQKYRISSHANDEMANDFLTADDIEQVVLTGQITHKFTHDPRGARYEVCGYAVDRRRACLVCRFLLSGVMLIITVYAK